MKSDFNRGFHITFTFVLEIGVTFTPSTEMDGADGKVLVVLDSSDQPLGPISFTACIRNLYSVNGRSEVTVYEVKVGSTLSVTVVHPPPFSEYWTVNCP